MQNLGDLNNDGSDELGVFLHGRYSCWHTYSLFINIHYAWANPLSLSRYCFMIYLPVETSSNGIKVRESYMDNDEAEIRTRSRFQEFYEVY